MTRDCREDPRAEPAGSPIELGLHGEGRSAEIASTSAPWAYRRCDLDLLLLVHDPGAGTGAGTGADTDAPGSAAPLPFTTCHLLGTVDAAILSDDATVSGAATAVVVLEGLATCDDEDCGRCPIHGADLGADAILLAPTGMLGLSVGDAVDGIP